VVRNDAHELYEPAEHGRDGFVRVLDMNVHYIEAGPDEPTAAAEPPIVLIPGAFSTYRVWNRVLPLLSAHHRVFVLDYIGTGDSDKPEEGFGYTVGEEADVVAAFLRELGLEKPLLAGVSYGASIALNVAARYPELPSRVVCVEGGVVIAPDVLNYGHFDTIFAVPVVGDGVLFMGSLGFFRESIAKSIMADAWEQLTEEERDQIVAIQASYLKTAVRSAMYDVYCAITGYIDFTAEMGRETAPILYLYGESSRYRDVAEANIAFFRERRCNVETLLLKNGIHDLQLQYPRAVAEIILDDARRARDPAPAPRPAGPVAIDSVACVRGQNFASAPRPGRAGAHALRTQAPPVMGEDLRPIPYLDPEE
jgi:pimeloyl-ACP methyl ester carboxylesterase